MNIQKAENKYGPLYILVPPQAVKGHSEMTFEKEFWKTLAREDYEIFIDVGAAWGYHTRVASHYAQEVYAFEPHPVRHKLLLRNTADLDNVLVSKNMIGTGIIQPFINPSKRGMVGPKSSKRIQPIDVRWTSLEALLEAILHRKGIIKIDVEGAELDVINSAGDLSRYKNYIWMIERHDRGDGHGISEETLFRKMILFEGELVEKRSWTYLYIFRWREGWT